MNKAELIDAVSVDSGLGKSEASSAVESVFKTIESQLAQAKQNLTQVLT